EAVEHLGQFSVGRTAVNGSVFGQRQQWIVAILFIARAKYGFFGLKFHRRCFFHFAHKTPARMALKSGEKHVESSSSRDA
ncbi:hypothetical protein, partial [Pseudomonas bohemica]|uniref:hypothetical protein n=1 Tax=Pseudomonas bohemica TaxID=2044872 RepID=UPI001F23673C